MHMVEEFACNPNAKASHARLNKTWHCIEQPWYRQLLFCNSSSAWYTRVSQDAAQMLSAQCSCFTDCTNALTQAVPISKWQMTAVRTKVAVKTGQQGTSTFAPDLSSSHS